MTEQLTLCWACNYAYHIGQEKCPMCGATNGNIDLAQAIAEEAQQRAEREWDGKK